MKYRISISFFSLLLITTLFLANVSVKNIFIAKWANVRELPAKINDELQQDSPSWSKITYPIQQYKLGQSFRLSPSIRLTPIRKFNTYNSTDDLHLHVLSEKEPYRSRMMDIHRRCGEMPSNSQKHAFDLSRFIFDDKHKVVMCVVPKNACSTLKRVMLYLNGRTRDINAVPTIILDLSRGHIKTFRSLKNITEIEHKLNTYTKFMVSRHPFERLVSAFKDKFENLPLSKKYGGKGKQMAKFMLKRRMQHKDKNYHRQINELRMSAKFGNISFNTFLGFLQTHYKRGNNFDVHWREQTLLCNPCAVDYDFIIDFNSFFEDGEKLLTYLQRNDPSEKLKLHLPPPNQRAVDESVAKSMFKTIEPEIISNIENIYKNDFYLFNYNPVTF